MTANSEPPPGVEKPYLDYESKTPRVPVDSSPSFIRYGLMCAAAVVFPFACTAAMYKVGFTGCMVTILVGIGTTIAIVVIAGAVPGRRVHPYSIIIFTIWMVGVAAVELLNLLVALTRIT